MNKFNIQTYKDPATCWILLGIPFISLVGSMMHFIYDWSGNLTVVGIFAPVNESVWEHLKMTFWPTLIWWLLGYFILRKKNKVSICLWSFSCTIALLVCPLFIVSFYYTYTGALGIHSLLLDISSLFLGVTIAQLLALHVYRYANPDRHCLYCACSVLILFMIAFFIIFTFIPPQIPLFLDSSSGGYGI